MLIEKVYQFLDSRIKNINGLKYVPTYKNVTRDLGLKFDSHYIMKWFRSRYKEKRVHFQNLTEIKLRAGLIKNAEVNQFLDANKFLIEDLEFLPTTGNVIQERPDLRNNPRLTKAIGEWLRQNNLPSITRLRELANQEPIKVKIWKILDSRKQEIINYTFLPTMQNIKSIANEVDDRELVREYINRWLKKNDVAENLTEYLRSIGIISDAERLKAFLNLKYQEIIAGRYFPTIKNLRKDQDQIGVDVNSYANLNNIRWKWFNDNVGKTMAQVIEEFNPTYEQLGTKLTSHDYPPKFKSLKFRVANAIFQTIAITDETTLRKLNPPRTFSCLRSLFSFLEKNEQWHFVDTLTGEIFTTSDYFNGIIDLHHVNFDKTDLAPDNLCFLFRDTHNFVTKSKHHFIGLCNFLTKLLRENIDLLKQNKIPMSWKVGWRKLASKEGITLPSKRYIQKSYRTTITEYCQSQKTIDSF